MMKYLLAVQISDRRWTYDPGLVSSMSEIHEILDQLIKLKKD